MAEMDEFQAQAVMDEDAEFEEDEQELKKKRTKERGKRDGVSKAFMAYSNFTYSPMNKMGSESNNNE